MKHTAKILHIIGTGLIAAACTASADVYGVVGYSGKIYKGIAIGHMDRTGTIDMQAEDGEKCVGAFRYTGSKTGSGELQCSDGKRAIIQFNALGMVSGYGFGTTDDGEPIKFAYGLTQDEAGPYIATPKRKAREKARSGPSTSSGTGFFVSFQGHVLTNAHVIQGCRSLSVRTASGKSFAPRAIAMDNRTDLAVLQTQETPEAIATFRPRSDYRQGDVVATYGFPLSEMLSSGGNLAQGHISALTGVHDNTTRMQISAPIQPGNSGGPLVTEDGKVAGVIVSRLNDAKVFERTGSLPQNTNFAIKSTAAMAFLDSHSIPYKVASYPGEPGKWSLADLGSMMKSYATHIICKN